MFNKTIDNKDLKFLQDRNKQLAFMNDIISNIKNIEQYATYMTYILLNNKYK